jgi:hypothetical protein
MVYNTPNYHVFGRCSSSDILKTREHNVLETGSLSILSWRGETPALLDLLERANLQGLMLTLSNRYNRAGIPIHLRTETDPVSETLCFLVFEYRTMEEVQKPSSSEKN